MKIIEGDLIEMFSKGEFDTIIHGCNCQHVMGAGIAGQINNIFPQALFSDKNNSNIGDIRKLSNWTSAAVQTEGGYGIIINLYTQFNPGKNLSISALDLGLYKLSQSLSKDVKIGIPQIGCGIAGGNWDEVQPIIEKYFSEHNLTIVNYKK